MMDDPLTNAPAELVGNHQVQVDENVILIRFHGDYLPAEAQIILDKINAQGRAHERFFILIDMSDTETASPETRRLLARWRPDGFKAIAIYFGADLIRRSALRLIEASMRITGKFVMESHHCATEQEARKLLEKLQSADRAT